MTIDERLEQLAERHVALTQTVELMAHMHQTDDKRSEEAHRRSEEAHKRSEEAHRRNLEAHQRYEEAHRRNEEAMAKNQTLIAQIMESITSLARIAQAHEHRISGLESN
jgi:hypothetical protein